MKARTLVSILILVLIVLINAGSSASGKKAIKDGKELYGTWINEEYNGIAWHFPKLIYNPDRTMSAYMTDLDNKQMLYGDVFIITGSWTDSEGNLWSKIEWHIGPYVEGTKPHDYNLSKISNAGRTLEFVWSRIGYPTEIDPNNNDYHILYHQ